MEPLQFSKYHGLGNDFIVVSDGDFPREQAWVQAICDRHRGLGADGVIYYEILESTEHAEVRMTIFNRDGSRPEICGNGVRCLVRHVDEVDELGADELVVQTDAGPRDCRILAREDDNWRVAVDMGVIETEDAPEKIGIGESEFVLWPVDVGNPHVVTFGFVRDERMDTVGSTLNSDHYLFPEGVNVEFAEVIGDNSIRVEVYERGVGRTMACGTGACAAAVAAMDRNEVDSAQPVHVELPGGRLEINREGDHVWLRGECRSVANGEITSSWLIATRSDIEEAD